jgi:NAD-dependent deacetylase
VCALTGAGVSAESGVPTFRGPGGLWQGRRPEELATPEAFAADPGLVWEFYHWRRNLVAGVQPNPAHRTLAELERRAPGFTLITQNVDGLHRLAGSRNLVEIHGCLWRLRCTGCGAEEENRSLELAPLPACPDCGGLLRPGVVWFGEMLDPHGLERSLEACRSADVMLVAGTSAVVQPAASFALVAKQAGAAVAEINLERTACSEPMDFVLTGKAGEVLPRLLE